MSADIPKSVFLGENGDIRVVHDSGLVALINTKAQRSILEYYPGGVSEDQQFKWQMVRISRGPTMNEVALFRAAVDQAKIATALMSTN